MSVSPTSGRRAAEETRRRIDVTLVLAIALPLLTIAASLLVRPDDAPTPSYAPEQSVLTRSTLVCPSGDSDALVATTTDASGEVAARVGDEESRVALSPGRVAEVAGERPVVVTGEGDLAPGLVGGRFLSPLAASTCREPAPDQWFTGVGAGARHRSVLELVNPDAGPALVDATVYGQDGVVDAPALRGVAVPARGAVRIDLAATLPRRDELAVRVTTARGRVAATMRDLYDQLGAGASAGDWLPAQAAPATSQLMLGLPTGSGQRMLTLANSGTGEVRAELRLVTESSIFSPEGVDDIVVPPESVTRVSLSKVLDREALRDVVGIQVTSSAPVTAGVRSFVDGDLSHTGPGEPVGDSAAVTPQGSKQLVLAGASRAGTVSVVATDADGQVVAEKDVDVVADAGFAVDLPSDAALVHVTTRATSIVGSIVVSDDGAAVIRLPVLVRDSLVADVRPGRP